MLGGGFLILCTEIIPPSQLMSVDCACKGWQSFWRCLMANRHQAQIEIADFSSSKTWQAQIFAINRDVAISEQLRSLLNLFLFELALRKLSYELTHSPERIRVPAHMIIELLETP